MSMIDKAKKAVAEKKAVVEKKAQEKAKAPEPIADSREAVVAAAAAAGKAASDIVRETCLAGSCEADKKKAGEARHYMMWVGGGQVREDEDGHKGGVGYPTVESFVREAKTMGVSKRLNMVTPHLIPGVTRVYLLHGRWFETSARYLESSAEVNGVKIPAISRMKSLRKIGMDMAVNAADLDARAIAIALGDPKSSVRAIWRAYEADIFRLLSGDKRDLVLRALVQNRAGTLLKSKIVMFDFVRHMGKPSKDHPKGTRHAITGLEAIAFLMLTREYAADLDSGKGFFGFFLLECLEFILPKGEHLPSYLDSKAKAGDTQARLLLDLISKKDGGNRDDDLPKVVRVIREEDETALAVVPRGCGWRRPGGVYAVTYKPADPKAIKDKGKIRLGTAGPLYVANDVIEAQGLDYFRGLRSVPDALAPILALEMELGAKKA